jgi:hypothetical protein
VGPLPPPAVHIHYRLVPCTLPLHRCLCQYLVSHAREPLGCTLLPLSSPSLTSNALRLPPNLVPIYRFFLSYALQAQPTAIFFPYDSSTREHLLRVLYVRLTRNDNNVQALHTWYLSPKARTPMLLSPCSMLIVTSGLNIDAHNVLSMIAHTK